MKNLISFGNLILSCTFLLSTDYSYSQSSLYFKGYDIKAQDNFVSSGKLIRTADSKYEVACLEVNAGEISQSVRITKFNEDASVIWSKRVIAGQDLDLPSICSTLDTGALLCCKESAFDTISNTYHLAILKLNDAGEIQWATALADSNPPYNLQTYSVGTGNYLSYMSGNSRACLIKFSSSGQMIWSKRFYFSDGSTYFGFGTTAKGSKIMLTGSFDGSQGMGLYTLLIDTSGTINYSRKFSGSWNNPRASMIDMGGNLISVGTVGTIYGIFTKISPQGDVIFFKNIDFGNYYDELWDILQTTDSNYYVLAEPESYIEKSQTAILKFDKDGNFEWMKVYNGSSPAFPFNALLNSDSTITIAGTLGGYNEVADLFLLKVDLNGNSVCQQKSEIPSMVDSTLDVHTGYFTDSSFLISDLAFYEETKTSLPYDACDSFATVSDFQPINSFDLMYPNPATNSIRLHLPEGVNIVSIYNRDGEKIKEEKIITPDFILDVSELANGMYVVRTGKKTIGKFIKD